MKNQEFSPREVLEHAFRNWWVVFLITALGGIAGWAFHFFNPPVYEATSIITVSMDFPKRQLTQFEQDYAFNAAGAIGTSDAVEGQVVTQANKIGIPIELNQLQQQIFLERKQSVWELHVRNQNPETAAKLANLWSQDFYGALSAALVHATQADQIQSQINSINASLTASGSTALMPEAQSALKALSDKLFQEQKASQGIISIMKFAQTGSASAPQSPVLYRWALLALAGAGIGFIISVWVVSSYGALRHA